MVSGEQVRVLLADDHPPIRAFVRKVLEDGGCEVVGEAGGADEAIRMTKEHRPDVVLLDIHMPGSGIHAAQEIGRVRPEAAVVMLTQSSDDEDLFDSLRAGAVGYLLKDTDPAQLVDKLRGVLRGEGALPPRLVARIMDEFRSPAKRRFHRTSREAGRLSPREWEVMELLAEGLTTEEVSERLFLAPTTVRVHVSAVLKKLRVKDRESAFKILRGEA